MCVCLFGYNFDGNTDNIHSKVEVSSAIKYSAVHNRNSLDVDQKNKCL